MKILIVDDDLVSRTLLGKTLEKMGHEIVAAENGLKAWEIFQKIETSLIVTDWMMPGMDGVSLCKKIREFPRDTYTYIIILTAKDKREDLIEVYEAGADDYIRKPLDTDEIKARIKTGERIVRLEQEHKDLEHILKESRNKLQTVFDSLHEEIISIDKESRIISANNAFMKGKEACYQEVIGKSYLNCMPDQDNPAKENQISPLVEKTFESGSPNFLLHSSPDKQGDKRYKEINFIPVKDEEDKTFQVVIVMRDITEERKKSAKIHSLNEKLGAAVRQVKTKNEKLEETLKRLKDTQAQILQSEKMSSIGQLAAGVAHEINNPTGFVSSNLKTLADYQEDITGLIIKYRKLLSDLKGAANGETLQAAPLLELADGILEEEDSVDIDFILNDISDLIKESQDGANRIKKIVLDLKDFAHPGEDKLQLADINENLESTLNIVWNEIKYKATVSKDYGELPEVSCYPQQLNQVFMNFLVNAAQAIEKSGEINIATRSVNGHVEVIIADTGSGIPEENIQKIFDPFFTTKDVGKGTGLGLNVAYNIIEKHKGTINVKSEMGKGTTFTIKIPVGGEA